MRTLCPRCNSETLELDKPVIEAGRKRIKVSLRLCPKCRMLFQEECA